MPFFSFLFLMSGLPVCRFRIWTVGYKKQQFGRSMNARPGFQPEHVKKANEHEMNTYFNIHREDSSSATG